MQPLAVCKTCPLCLLRCQIVHNHTNKLSSTGISFKCSFFFTWIKIIVLYFPMFQRFLLNLNKHLHILSSSGPRCEISGNSGSVTSGCAGSASGGTGNGPSGAAGGGSGGTAAAAGGGGGRAAAIGVMAAMLPMAAMGILGVRKNDGCIGKIIRCQKYLWQMKKDSSLVQGNGSIRLPRDHRAKALLRHLAVAMARSSNS